MKQPEPYARFGRKVIVSALLLGFLALGAGAAEAGWVIESRRSGGGQQEPEKETNWFQRDKVRTEGGDYAHVLNYKERKFIGINKKEKKYSVMTFDEYRKKVLGAMKVTEQWQEDMKRKGNFSPADAKKEKVTVKRLGGGTVAGYPCDGFRVTRGDAEGTIWSEEEFWITNKIDLSSEFGPAAMKEFDDLSREQDRLGMGSWEDNLDPAYKKIFDSGYTMKEVDKRGNSTNEVTRAERKSIDDSLFREPKGYARVPFEKLYPPPPGMMPEGVEFPDKMPESLAAPPPEPPPPARATDDGAGGVVEEDTDNRKQGEGRGKITEGVGEGIKKLFKW